MELKIIISPAKKMRTDPDGLAWQQLPEFLPQAKELAARLRVTASTLTVAVKTLENKGYLVRRRSERDKLKVIVALTPGAEAALARHTAFHARLIRQVTGRLTPAQTEQLADTLSTLHRFFAPDAQDGAAAPRKGDEQIDPHFD